MTGFGYNEFQVNEVKFFITIKSVNSKYLDININLPLDLQNLEEPMNKIIKDEFTRGKFDAYIGVDKSTLISRLKLNEGLLDEYLKLVKKINKKIDSQNEVSINDIISFNGMVNIRQNGKNNKFDESFKNGFSTVLNHLKKMRQIEGKSIYKNVIMILNNMISILKRIKKKLPRIIQDYQKKLKAKIEGLIDIKSLDDNRILMEVALFADKMDINEEIERLQSHLHEMRKYLDGKKPCGKLMEFLLQEMLREVNTIGSKVSDIEVIRNVIVMKDSIEQMREQARNVE